MTYQLKSTQTFDKQFKKLDRHVQRQIKEWLTKHIDNCENPRAHGKGLVANRSGQWRYRIGDYRVIAHIDDTEVIVLALKVGHRRDVY